MTQQIELITVYILTNNVNGKQYVGITTNLKGRLRQHRHKTSGCRALKAAIDKYGWDSFSVSEIASLPMEEAGKLEADLIRGLGTQAPGGYNLALGGAVVSGYRWTNEARKQLSESRRGQIGHPNALAALARYQGQKLSEEARAKISAKKKGVKLTPAHVEAMSKSRKGKAAWGTRIEIDGTQYPHMKAAADALGVHKATISYRAKNNWPGYRVIGRLPLGGNDVSEVKL